MQFKTMDLQFGMGAKTPANGAKPWAAAQGGKAKKGPVIYGGRGLAMTLAVVLNYAA